jgi:hypothetical protein
MQSGWGLGQHPVSIDRADSFAQLFYDTSILRQQHGSSYFPTQNRLKIRSNTSSV